MNGPDSLALIFVGILIGIALTLSASNFIAQAGAQPEPTKETRHEQL